MHKTETITSAANPLIKDVRRAVVQGGLTQQGLWVAETFHLLDEALRSRCEVLVLLVADSAQRALQARQRQLSRTKVMVLPDDLLQKVSGTESSQGVIALVRPPQWEIDQVFGRGEVPRPASLVVVLDSLQDPGNVGTIVRAAEAFGATGMLLLKGTASPHNPKTLRASAGSLFRVPLQHAVDPVRALDALRRHGTVVYAAVSAAKDERPLALKDADLTAPCGLVIGNEAHGIGSDMRCAARALSIPTVGVESLNAAMAAAILLYEARRQREFQR